MTLQLLGLSQDNNSSFMTGPTMAPARIREALVSDSANMFTESGLDLGQPGLWQNADDPALAELSGQQAFDAIFGSVSSLTRGRHKVLSLGGDHSVSYPVILAHAEKHPGLNVLHFDAHPDLYDKMLNNPFSHASPFARLMESGKIARLVQVGIRTQNAHQRDQAKRFGVETHFMNDLSGVNALKFDGPLYVSFDLDALDPAFAPGVSHFEPGGLSTRQALDFIQNADGDIVGADVVELNPNRDPYGMTAMVAAKIAKELMARMIEG